MEKLEYGKLWSFSRKNFKIRLVRSINKIFAYLHQKLSQIKDYLLEKINESGSWASVKIQERDSI